MKSSSTSFVSKPTQVKITLKWINCHPSGWHRRMWWLSPRAGEGRGKKTHSLLLQDWLWIRWGIKTPAQCWLPFSSCSAPFPTSATCIVKHKGKVKVQHQCLSAVQCYLHKPSHSLMETPGMFMPSILSSTHTWGRSSAIMRKLTALNHTSLKGSGRAGWELIAKNNICTLWQLPHHCGEAYTNMTSVAAVCVLPIAPQVFSPFPPVPTWCLVTYTFIFVVVCLQSTENPFVPVNSQQEVPMN